MQQMEKMNEVVGMMNRIMMDVEGKRLVVLSTVESYRNELFLFYRQLRRGINYTSFGVRYQYILVRWDPLNYKDMFVETPFYIRYVVITIVISTSMLDIELFYLTQLSSSTYLTLSFTGLRHILEKV